MSMDAREIKDLSDKISQVNIDMTREMGKMQIEVSATMGEVRGTLSQIVAKMEAMELVKRDLQEVRDLGRDSFQSTKSAHLRIDEVNTEIKPLIESNVLDRTAKLESNIRWTVTTLAVFILGLVGFWIQLQIKGG